MNKIGFIITRTSQGFSKLKSYNDGHWSSRVADVRTYLGVFPDAVKDGNVLPFFSFDREGCLLGLLRAIPGRSGDNLCGWLYIPYNIAVTGAQIAELVEFVKGVLSKSSLTEVERELDERFSREYPTYRAQLYAPSTGSKYAVRNPLNLEEILEHRYQMYYKNYGVVFLADPALLAPDYRPSVVDLTGKPVASLVSVLPPSSLGKDVSLVLAANGQPFTSSVRVDKTKALQLIMRRPGFAEMPVRVENLVDGQPVTLPASYRWSRTVSRAEFIAVDEYRKPIPDASISINGKTLHQSLSVPENECEEAKVIFSAPNYKRRSINVNLLEDLPVTETLYKDVVPPIGGPGGHGNRGGYGDYGGGYGDHGGGSNPWKTAVIALVLLFLCCCLGLGIWYLCQTDQGATAPETPPPGTDTVFNYKLDTAKVEKIKNLPKDVWVRQELAKVGLEELWDALNEYRIDELTDEGEWGKLLREARYDNVVNAAIQARRQNVKHTRKYCSKDDDEITLNKYVENLPKQPTEPESKQDSTPDKNNGNSSAGSSGNGSRGGTSSAGSSDNGSRGGTSSTGNNGDGSRGGTSSTGGSGNNTATNQSQL